jgi:hypothetical protein
LNPDSTVGGWRVAATPRPREPSPGLGPRSSAVPRRRSGHWSYEGTAGRAGASPFPVPIWAACPDKGLADAGPKGIGCARPDLNRDAPRGALTPRASASAFPPRARASLRAASNRLPSPYEGDALPGELQRHGCHSWIRTMITGIRIRRPACWTKWHRVRETRVERASGFF